MWWNINKTLSYNCLFNFIVGNRGGGKTYGCKEYCLKRWLKTGEQFVYMRRNENELKRNVDLWRDMRKNYLELELSQKGFEYKVNKQLAGSGFSLSLADKYKSVSYDGVHMIIFDEFIVDNPRSGYLKDEVTKFLDAYETIARMRDVRVFFLANAVTAINPYFTYFNIDYPKNGNFQKWDDILVEVVQDQEYIDAKKKTRFGKMIAGSEYQKYSLENQFLSDNTTFIEKKTGNLKYMATLASDLGEFGLWQNFEGLIFISPDTQETTRILAVDLKAHGPGRESLKTPNGKVLWNYIKGSFNHGYVRFEDQRCKLCFTQIYGKTLT